VELLKELLPDAARVAYLRNMSNPVAQPQWEQIEIAAHLLGIIPELYDIRSRDDVRRAFKSAIVKSINAGFVGNDGVTQENRSLIAELAARGNFPTIYGAREFVEAGGLMSYSVSYPQLYYDSARLVNKISRGSKAGDLPVEQPTKFSLVINLLTAKALGLTIPGSFLLRADEVIE
jgi:putative ABC transport system substrate-binding protein